MTTLGTAVGKSKSHKSYSFTPHKSYKQNGRQDVELVNVSQTEQVICFSRHSKSTLHVSVVDTEKRRKMNGQLLQLLRHSRQG